MRINTVENETELDDFSSLYTDIIDIWLKRILQ
jgi:hypothetical protein